MSIIENPIVLGVDIGGSHITAALVNLETRTLISGSYKRKDVNSRDGAEAIIDNWFEIINDSFSSIEISSKKIGIAMPGPFDYKNGIALMQNQDKFDALYKLSIKEMLAKRLGLPSENIRFVNDALSFLQGEVFCGAVRNYNRVLGLTLGTGLGSAIYKNGITEDADLWNSKFKEGIAEDYLSGRWFLKRYAALSGNTVQGVKELLELPAAKIYVKQIFSEFAKNLSDFIIPLIQKYELEAIVIGGNISNAFELFLPLLKEILEGNRMKVATKIGYLKEDASLVGAASCWEGSFCLNE